MNKQDSWQQLAANFEAALDGDSQDRLAFLNANSARPPNLGFLGRRTCSLVWARPIRVSASPRILICLFVSASDKQSCLLFHLIERQRGRVRVCVASRKREIAEVSL